MSRKDEVKKFVHTLRGKLVSLDITRHWNTAISIWWSTKKKTNLNVFDCCLCVFFLFSPSCTTEYRKCFFFFFSVMLLLYNSTNIVEYERKTIAKTIRSTISCKYNFKNINQCQYWSQYLKDSSIYELITSFVCVRFLFVCAIFAISCRCSDELSPSPFSLLRLASLYFYYL